MVGKDIPYSPLLFLYTLLYIRNGLCTFAQNDLIMANKKNRNSRKHRGHDMLILGNDGNLYPLGGLLSTLQSGSGGDVLGGVASLASNAISGGMSTGVGSAMQTLGGIASNIPGIGGVIGAGVNVLGGIVNKAFGSKINKKFVADTKQNIAENIARQFDSSSIDSVLSQQSDFQDMNLVNKNDVGKDGWFSNKAKNLAKRLNEQIKFSNAYNMDKLSTAFSNAGEAENLGLLANFAAYGGQLFKNGGGIHIKKANRGKFTEYCGGKVTSECIARGKHSSSPAVRKRATFAQNARGWKHADGGPLEDGDLSNKLVNAAFYPLQRKYPVLKKLMNDYYNTSVVLHKDGEFVKGRNEKDLSLTIPFIEDKKVKLTNAGDATGSVISTNLLDSVAKHAAKYGIPFEEAIGVPAYETKLGNYKPYTFLKTKEQYNKAKKDYPEGYYSGKGEITPTELYNDHNYFIGPYRGDINAKIDVSPMFRIGHPDYYIRPWDITDPNLDREVYNEENEKYFKSRMPALEKREKDYPVDEDPYKHAVMKARRGDYNTGDKKWRENAKKAGADIMSSPEVQEWWNEEGKKWYNKKALGGPLGTHGGDFTNGITFIGSGGTHEQNPFEGVQMGINPDGEPNLVEEGEVVYNDYVFSNRLKVPKKAKKDFKLKGETFADAAKNLQKESEERPNDPISKRGLEASMGRLAGIQEGIRVKRNNNRFDDGGPIGVEREINLPDYTNQNRLTMSFLNRNPMAFMSNEGNIITPQTASPQEAVSKDPANSSDGLSPTWMRYAPVAGSAFSVLSDMFANTNRPDYGPSDYINGAIKPIKPIGARTINNYLTYKPLDTDYMTNKLNANRAARRRGILNTSGGNRATAMAGLIASDYNYGNQLGDLTRQAEMYNEQQRQRVQAFNRGTNQFNAEALTKADAANANIQQQQNELRLKQRLAQAQMRDTANVRSSQARSANLTNLLDNLGAVGQENFVRNMIASNPALYYDLSSKGGVEYKGKNKKKRGGRLTYGW